MSTVDCSRYQGVLSVSLLQGWKAAGVTRVILKLGGGDSGRYQDSRWATNSVNVRAAGLILEGYWFNGTTDPAGDASFANSIAPAGIRIWADVENEGSMPHWTDDQADTFERGVIAGGHPSGTYMSASVTFGSWPKCSRRPLWVAGYGFSTVPKVGNWVAPVLWQYTSTGHLPGYAGNLDLDQDLAGLAEASATPITPTSTEDDMPKPIYYLAADNGGLSVNVGKDDVWVRNAPGEPLRRMTQGQWSDFDTPAAGLVPDRDYFYKPGSWFGLAFAEDNLVHGYTAAAHPWMSPAAPQAVDLKALEASIAAQIAAAPAGADQDALKAIATQLTQVQQAIAAVPDAVRANIKAAL